MAWTQVIWFIVSTIVSIALAPKPKAPRAAALEDFDFPTAEEGRPIPVVFGTVDISGPNVLWYGNLWVRPIKKRSGFSKQTVGYKYYIAYHLGLCHGPVNAVKRIRWGEKDVWSGTVTTNTSIGINDVNLWGGEKRGGGLSGAFDIMMGADDQGVNDYLLNEASLFAQSGFRGILGAVWKGGYVGTSESIRPVEWRVERTTAGWNTDVWYPEKAVIATTDPVPQNHMNPAHICYQLLTDPEWGMGVPTNLINTETWEAAADLFYEEGFGLDLLWNQQATIEEFLKIVLDHCAAAISLRTSTGQFDLTPIRGDYDPDDLITLDPSNVKELTDYQRQGWGETVNEVTLVYTDPETGKDTAVSAHDLGNQEAQGRRIPATVELPGIQIHDIAKEVVQRELAARVTPLGKGQIIVNRRGWRLPYNAVFKLTWPERGIEDVVHRVVSINRGTLPNGEIVIDFVEDIYAYELGTYLTTEPQLPPDAPPTTPDDPEDTGIGVISSTQTEPPTGASDGDSYYVPDGATGEWAGHEGEYADWDEESGEWLFTPAAEGALVYDEETQETFQVIGGELVPFGGGGSITLVDMDDTPDEEISPVSTIAFADAEITDLGSGDVLVKVSPNTTKGDLATHDGTLVARLAVGADGMVLSADSTAANGIAWKRRTILEVVANGDADDPEVIFFDGDVVFVEQDLL